MDSRSMPQPITRAGMSDAQLDADGPARCVMSVELDTNYRLSV